MTMDIDSDIESEEELDWLLGFAEAARHSRDLLRHAFPSKIGGRPAWLDPLHLPTKEQLTCSTSGSTLQFLLQVYAPVDENPNAFHRTMYVFISPRGDKLTTKGAVKAFRCQLPRLNSFYPAEPQKPLPNQPPALSSDDLQQSLAKDPWKSEQNLPNTSIPTASESEIAAVNIKGLSLEKESPSTSGANNTNISKTLEECPKLLAEAELVVEPEPEELDISKDPTGQEMIDRYNARNAAEGEYTEEELPGEVMDTLESNATPEQQHFAMFAARIAKDPEQCLRYCFDPLASPLCPSPNNIPKAADIPCCERCGGPRQFEFQIMPQLLHFLEVDAEDPQAPDWGTIAVYSCAASCGGHRNGVEQGEESAYVEEYVWVQPPA